MEKRCDNEGFQEVGIEEQKVKDKDSPTPQQHRSIIPEAKPILSCNFILKNTPKILVKQIKITVEPPELYLNSMSPAKGVLPGLSKQQFFHQRQTLYEHYILSNQYELVYYRYSKAKVKQIPSRDIKKMFSKQYFCSYFLKLDFIKQYSNYLVRNLQEANLEAQVSVPVQEIQFNSRFQCGNLFAVFKSKYSQQVYDLVLQNDINTKGYSQWFYFSIRNKEAKKIKIRIINMAKMDSLFQKGMKPAVFSYRRMVKSETGWERRGDNIQYGLTNYLKEGDEKALYSYLSFEINLEENDITYISTTIPYSYTRLEHYLSQINQKCESNNTISYKQDKLTSTISFNPCYLLTITSKRNKGEPKIKKKYSCIIGRQHPCETVGSFVMEGIINFLVSGKSEANELLKKYIFKIMPMMNPDGVIYGNSRCDISGADINRQWGFPSRDLYPTVSACKAMMTRLTNSGHEIQYFFDVHGHSKQLNSFIYGPQFMNEQASLRLLPFIISKLNNFFSFPSCQFGISLWKRRTARANAIRQMKFSHRSYTIETSTYGHGTIYNSQHFTAQKLNNLGFSIMMAFFLEKFKPSENAEGINIKKIEEEVHDLLKEKNRKTSEIQIIENQKQQSKSGSDSQPSDGEFEIQQKQQIFLPHALAEELREAEKLDEAEKQKQLRKEKNMKCISKESSKTMEKPKKIVLQKLKLTNPVPFTLSQSRSKVPRPKKIEIQKIQRGGTVPLSQIPMIVDIPEHPFLNGRRNKQSLVQTIKRLQRKSFFETFRKDIDNAQDSKRHHRYSQNSKEPFRAYKALSTVQPFEMKSYDSVDRLHQKRLSSLIEKTKKAQKTLLQKFDRPLKVYRNRSNRGL